MHAALVRLSLGLDGPAAPQASAAELPLARAAHVRFAVAAGGLSLLELPAPAATRVKCFNSAAHLAA